MKRSMTSLAMAFGIFFPYVPKLEAQIPGAETNAAPAAASVGGIVYTAWMGKTLPTDNVWYYPDAADSQAIINNTLTSEAPALASDGTNLLLAYNSNGYINYMIYTGSEWKGGTACGAACPPAYTGRDSYASGAPALAVSGSTVYVAWVESGQIYVASYAGGAWTLLPSPNATTTGTAPALAIYNNTLFLAWLVAPWNVNYTTYSLSGSSWTPVAATPAVTGVPPALGVYTYGSALYLAWTGASEIYYSKWNGTGWNPAVGVTPSAPLAQLTPALVSSSPTVAVCPNPVVDNLFSVVYASPSSSNDYSDLYIQTLINNQVGKCTCHGTSCF